MSDNEKKKDCGCNKKKTKIRQYTEEELKKQAEPQNRMTMVKSFATAIASRGFGNKKTTEPIKRLRVLSCLGNEHLGGELPPCQHLQQSKTDGKYFCGGCGCGDSPRTWLLADAEEYSKLDYPALNCPLKMPGFTNYSASEANEAEEPVTRKYYIENMDFEDIATIPVTTPEAPPEVKKE